MNMNGSLWRKYGNNYDLLRGGLMCESRNRRVSQEDAESDLKGCDTWWEIMYKGK